MEELTIFIVDDEPYTHEVISSYQTFIPGISILGFETDPQKAIKVLLSKEIEPDIIILDVEMPEKDGVKVSQALQVVLNCVIIFITGHTEYGFQAFEVDAVDYILKPIQLPRFLLALTKAKRRIAQNSGLSDVYIDQLFILGNGRNNYYPLPVDKIRYIKSDSAYSHIFTIEKINDKDHHYTHYALKDLDKTLDASKFIRVSRSYIVNIARIRNVVGLAIEMDDGYDIKITDAYKDAVRARLRLGKLS